MNKLTQLIYEDMKPALGVTEPGAIAFAVSTARSHTEGEIVEVEVRLNSGMYKNAFTCGIPNSDQVGNVFSVALGVVAGRPEKGLESLADVTEADNLEAEKLVAQGRIKVILDHIGSEIKIDARVKTKQDECIVRIAGSHTGIYCIEKNGAIIFEAEEATSGVETIGKLALKEKNTKKRTSLQKMTIDEAADGERSEMSEIHRYTLKDLLDYIDNVEAEEIAFIDDAFQMNMELLEEGLKSEKTTFAPLLKKQNGGVLFSEDERKTAQLLCNGAIEARVLGLSRPAMSITGSGAHGIIATLPLYAYQKINEGTVEKHRLWRATALSYLITMYIKEYSGKLSAFCGCGIAAGTGMACGLCYLQGGGLKEVEMVIRNMASGITGMICDGGNQGCTMKGIVAVDAAFRAVEMAMAHVSIEAVHGINGKTPEETMKHMGQIASPGMVETEKTIVTIMEKKE